MTKLKPVSTSQPGEVAVFVSNLDQFQSGKSAYKCAEYGVGDIYYCGPPGGVPSGTAGDIDAMASADYQQFIGADVASDTNGTSPSQLEAILSSRHLSFTKLSVTESTVHSGDILNVANALGNGVPVLVSGTEVGFVDVKMGRVPYTWAPTGTHTIVVSGIAPSGNFLVHDYASINPILFPPGSTREYDNSQMFMVSAYSVVPRWYSGGLIPDMIQAANDCWGSVIQNLNRNTGIYKDWLSLYTTGHSKGPPLTGEYATVDWSGNKIVAQEFRGGRCEWNNGPKWY